MLKKLLINNFILIDNINLSFSKGLAIFTGETGAGKTILLNALALALGARANTNIIGHGKKQAVISAIFSPRTDTKLLLDKIGIIVDDNIIIRRIITSNGKTEAFVNDNPISISFLKELGSKLIEVHCQFDKILNRNIHIDALDQYAGLNKLQKKLSNLYTTWKKTEKKLEEQKNKTQENEKRKKYLHSAIIELDSLNIIEGEEEDLIKEQNILLNKKNLVESIKNAISCFSYNEGIEEKTIKAYKLLENSSKSYFKEVLKILDSILIENSEVILLLEKLLNKIESKPNRLQEIKERLFVLRSTANKYGYEINKLKNLQEKYKKELESIISNNRNLDTLIKNADIAKKQYINTAKEISKTRHSFAKKLDNEIKQEFLSLKLEHAIFYTKVSSLSEEKYCEKGIDNVEFLAKTNKGIPMTELSKITSGGEQARFMLALKSVLAHKGDVSTIIFDEIDNGVSGSTATAIGKKLHSLSKKLQVLAITHSPQVASWGNFHFLVQKKEVNEKTITNVTMLTTKEKREEIARMLAGHSITKEVRTLADSFIKQKTNVSP